jgi:hypothetical protein
MFAHSPESWTKLWIGIFTQLEGSDFAQKHVKMNARLDVSDLST